MDLCIFTLIDQACYVGTRWYNIALWFACCWGSVATLWIVYYLHIHHRVMTWTNTDRDTGKRVEKAVYISAFVAIAAIWLAPHSFGAFLILGASIICYLLFSAVNPGSRWSSRLVRIT